MTSKASRCLLEDTEPYSADDNARLPKDGRQVMHVDYYSEMLDLEGLDPDLGGLERIWSKEECQRGLLAHLFQHQRLDVVRSLVEGELLTRGLGQIVEGALHALVDVYRRLPDIREGELRRLSPKILAKKELLAWRPEVERELAQLLAVEVPVRLDWSTRGVNINDEGSVLQFYKESESYIFELMAANNLVQTLYNYNVVIDKLKLLGFDEFIDYGAGAGTFVILGAARGFRVKHIDLESRTLDFASWRYRRRGMDVPMLFAKGDHTDLPESPLIVCTEVVEHLFRPLDLLDAFVESIPFGGCVVISESCAYTEKFVSHLPQNCWLSAEVFNLEMGRRGFFEVLPEPRVHPRIFRRS